MFIRKLGLTVTIFACAVTGGVAGAAADDAQMSADEIKAKIAGNTVYVSGMNGSTKWEWAGYFKADGSVIARIWWAGGAEKAPGVWKLEGDQYCSQYENKNWGGGELNCYELFLSEGKVKSIAVSGPEEGRTQVWKILDGNHHGL